jgi:hypothetical protein
MGIMQGAKRVVTDTADVTKRVVTGTADVTSSAAGAVGGAAITGVIGGVEGAVQGVRNGLGTGSRSTPLAALTLAGVGAAGLVEWPLLVTIGGGALLLHQLNRRNGATEQTPKPAKSTPRAAAGQEACEDGGEGAGTQTGEVGAFLAELHVP